ncbi:MAG TPA: phosphatase PAP2 family protein [Armatimonadota bacterium]|nr:phosphatase PAP2 family protein [Armatimonadota bacterium]
MSGHFSLAAGSGNTITRHPGAWPAQQAIPCNTPIVHHRGVFEDFSVNIKAFYWINSHHTNVSDVFFRFYSYLGSGWVLLLILLFAFFYRKRLVLPLIIAIAIETIIVTVMKQVFDQPRPAALLDPNTVHFVTEKLFLCSFPSGDTAMAAVIGFVMQYGERWGVRLLWILYPVLIAYERVYIGVHFPLDVVTGFVIGALVALGTLWFMRKRLLEKSAA